MRKPFIVLLLFASSIPLYAGLEKEKYKTNFEKFAFAVIKVLEHFKASSASSSPESSPRPVSYAERTSPTPANTPHPSFEIVRENLPIVVEAR